MSKQSKLRVKDLVSIGIYTALYVVTVAVAAIVCVFIIPGYSYVFIPVVAALLAGPIFMLLVAKVPRFGAISIMGSIMGLLFLLSGRFPGALVPAIIFALLADFVAYLFKYKSGFGLTLSYIIFSFNTVGPVLPMFLNSKFYMNDLIKQGRDDLYIQSAFANINQTTMIILIIATIICATISAIVGQRMMKKHFQRAGLI